MIVSCFGRGLIIIGFITILSGLMFTSPSHRIFSSAAYGIGCILSSVAQVASSAEVNADAIIIQGQKSKNIINKSFKLRSKSKVSSIGVEEEKGGDGGTSAATGGVLKSASAPTSSTSSRSAHNKKQVKQNKVSPVSPLTK